MSKGTINRRPFNAHLLAVSLKEDQDNKDASLDRNGRKTLSWTKRDQKIRFSPSLKTSTVLR